MKLYDTVITWRGHIGPLIEVREEKDEYTVAVHGSAFVYGREDLFLLHQHRYPRKLWGFFRRFLSGCLWLLGIKIKGRCR